MSTRDLRETEPWILYQRGKDHHNLIKLYSESEKAYNFYEDRQWQGVEAGGETLPFYNIIKRKTYTRFTCHYKSRHKYSLYK